eukprot:3934445-Rhodomonas_salina.4
MENAEVRCTGLRMENLARKGAPPGEPGALSEIGESIGFLAVRLRGGQKVKSPETSKKKRTKGSMEAREKEKKRTRRERDDTAPKRRVPDESEFHVVAEEQRSCSRL